MADVFGNLTQQLTAIRAALQTATAAVAIFGAGFMTLARSAISAAVSALAAFSSGLMKVATAARSTIAGIASAISSIQGAFGTAQKAVGKLLDFFQPLTDKIAAVGSGIGTLASAVGSVTGKFAGLGMEVGTTAVKGLIDFTGQGLKSVDALAKTADKLGITTESLVGFKQAAAMSGVEADTATSALQNMQTALDSARTGSGPAADALTRLGLGISQMSSVDPVTAFGMISNALNGTTNAADKSALAVTLFGDAGKDAMALVAGGSLNLANGADQAERFGLSISRVDAAKVELANRAMDQLGTIVEGVKERLAIGFAPLVEGVANAFGSLVAAAGGIENLINPAIAWLNDAVATMASVVQGAYIGWQMFGNGVKIIIFEAMKLLDKLGGTVNWIGDILAATGEAIPPSWDTVWASFKVGVAFLKQLFAGFAVTVNDSLATAMAGAAKAAGYFSSDLESKLSGAAESLRGNSHAFAEQAKSDYEQARIAAEGSADRAGAAWVKTQGVFAQGPKGTEVLAKYLANLEANIGDTSEHINHLMSQGWWGDAVRKATAEATVTQTMNANKIAQAAKVALEAKQEAAKTAGSEMHDPASDGAEAKQLTDAKAQREAARLEERDALANQLDQEAQQRQSAEEKEIARYQARLAKIKELRGDTSGDMYADSLEAKAKEEHENNMTNLEKSAQQKRLGQASQMMGNLSSLMRTKNKQLFEVGKAAAIGQATVDTYVAANKAYAEGGPYLGPVLAAAAVVAGLANVATIASTQYGGGGGGGGGASAAGSTAAAAATAAPQAAATSVHLALDDDGIYSGRAVRRLIDGINAAVKDGYTLRLT
jgi:hypothetical protein